MYKRALLLTLSTFVAFGAIADEAILKSNLPETEQEAEAVDSKDALAGCSCKKKGQKAPETVAADAPVVEQAEEVNIVEEKIATTADVSEETTVPTVAETEETTATIATESKQKDATTIAEAEEVEASKEAVVIAPVEATV